MKICQIGNLLILINFNFRRFLKWNQISLNSTVINKIIEFLKPSAHINLLKIKLIIKYFYN
jgi:hypothetical protein